MTRIHCINHITDAILSDSTAENSQLSEFSVENVAASDTHL